MIKGFTPIEKEMIYEFGLSAKRMKERGILNIKKSGKSKIVMKCLDFSVQFNDINELLEWLKFGSRN